MSGWHSPSGSSGSGGSGATDPALLEALDLIAQRLLELTDATTNTLDGQTIVVLDGDGFVGGGGVENAVLTESGDTLVDEAGNDVIHSG